MRWVRYEHEGHGHVGQLQGDSIQPVAASSLFDGAFDGTLPSAVENIYPAPWKTDMRSDIAETFGKKQIQGCGKFRYRQRTGGLNEYVVQCTRDGGTNWLTYFVWPASDGVTVARSSVSVFV